MARSDEDWDKILNAFEPDEVLMGKRSDDLYCEREHSPFQRMQRCFRLGERPSRPPIAFFTGHRGSGKSSLLMRLLEELRHDHFIVYFDILHNLDDSTANQIDLLYLLGATVFKVGQDEGHEPDEKHFVQLARAIETLHVTHKETKHDESIDVVELTSQLICAGASTFGAGKVAETLTKAFLKPFKLSAGVSAETIRNRDSEPRIQEVIDSVNLIITDVQTRAVKPVLVVIDGLDKLPSTEQAKLIFVESRALHGPQCRLIYTVPMSIYASLDFGQVKTGCKSFLLPNIKLYNRKTKRKYGNGYKGLREITTKRLDAVGLDLGDLFAPRALELLSKKSGGVVRWFIELIHNACIEAQIQGEDRVTLAAARRAVEDYAADLVLGLTLRHVKELREIRRNHWPSGKDEASELLQSLLVVAYRNSKTWFDAHPLIWESLDMNDED
jgi:hypothetical protein